jgi:hypothetical protein
MVAITEPPGARHVKTDMSKHICTSCMDNCNTAITIMVPMHNFEVNSGNLMYTTFTFKHLQRIT